MQNKCKDSFFLAPTDIDEISKIISGLKPKFSTGYDSISTVLLKKLNPSLS